MYLPELILYFPVFSEMEIRDLFVSNLMARTQLELGNQSAMSQQLHEAENAWNNAIKLACNVSCYDAGLWSYLPPPLTPHPSPSHPSQVSYF